MLRDYEDGLAIAPSDYTVKDAIGEWLRYGLSSRDQQTVETCTHLCRSHVVPALGARKLRDLSAEDVDRWLAAKAQTLSTRTLQGLHSCLNRADGRAMARDKVKRNVMALCSVPQGRRYQDPEVASDTRAASVLHRRPPCPARHAGARSRARRRPLVGARLAFAPADWRERPAARERSCAGRVGGASGPSGPP